MKKLLLLSFLFCTFGLMAQSDDYQRVNQKRIHTINQRMEEFLAIENYSAVARLQKEKEIREELKKVYNGKEEKARIMELKNNLLHCDCTPPSLTPEMESLRKKVSMWNNRNRYKDDNFVLYTEFMIMNYVNSATNTPSNGVNYFPFYEETPPKQDRYYKNYIGLGFKIGSSFFFSEMEKDQHLKIGFDIVYFSFMVGISSSYSIGYFSPVLPTMIVLNFPQPGIVLSQFFNNQSGFEAKANIGFVKSFGFNLTGIGGRLSAKYWLRKFSVGLDYQYSTSIVNERINDSRIHQVGLSVGMRF